MGKKKERCSKRKRRACLLEKCANMTKKRKQMLEQCSEIKTMESSSEYNKNLYVQIDRQCSSDNVSTEMTIEKETQHVDNFFKDILNISQPKSLFDCTSPEKTLEVTSERIKSLLNTLDREISMDIIVDKRPDKMKAFNLSLLHKDQWRATRNGTKEKWRSAKNVPRDLVTLKTVWEGITGLRSVREYCRWMLEHPEYHRAPYLNSLGMFDTAVLNARSMYNLENEPPPTTISYTTSALTPMEQLKKRLSVLVENESKEQVEPATEPVDPTTEQIDAEA